MKTWMNELKSIRIMSSFNSVLDQNSGITTDDNFTNSLLRKIISNPTSVGYGNIDFINPYRCQLMHRMLGNQFTDLREFVTGQPKKPHLARDSSKHSSDGNSGSFIGYRKDIFVMLFP